MTTVQILFLCLLIYAKFAHLDCNPINDCESPELDIQKFTIQALLKISAGRLDGHKFKVFLNCAWETQGLIDEEGNIQMNKVRDALVEDLGSQFSKSIAEEEAGQALKYCQDSSENSVKLVRCLGRWKVQLFIDYERMQPV